MVKTSGRRWNTICLKSIFLTKSSKYVSSKMFLLPGCLSESLNNNGGICGLFYIKAICIFFCYHRISRGNLSYSDDYRSETRTRDHIMCPFKWALILVPRTGLVVFTTISYINSIGRNFYQSSGNVVQTLFFVTFGQIRWPKKSNNIYNCSEGKGGSRKLWFLELHGVFLKKMPLYLLQYSTEHKKLKLIFSYVHKKYVSADFSVCYPYKEFLFTLIDITCCFTLS